MRQRPIITGHGYTNGESHCILSTYHSCNWGCLQAKISYKQRSEHLTAPALFQEQPLYYSQDLWSFSRQDWQLTCLSQRCIMKWAHSKRNPIRPLKNQKPQLCQFPPHLISEKNLDSQKPKGHSQSHFLLLSNPGSHFTPKSSHRRGCWYGMKEDCVEDKIRKTRSVWDSYVNDRTKGFCGNGQQSEQ